MYCPYHKENIKFQNKAVVFTLNKGVPLAGSGTICDVFREYIVFTSKKRCTSSRLWNIPRTRQ